RRGERRVRGGTAHRRGRAPQALRTLEGPPPRARGGGGPPQARRRDRIVTNACRPLLSGGLHAAHPRGEPSTPPPPAGSPRGRGCRRVPLQHPARLLVLELRRPTAHPGAGNRARDRATVFWSR